MRADGTKAATLVAAGRYVRRAEVPRLVHFSVREWRRRPDVILRRIAAAIAGTVAVRSSARDEDGCGASRAGHYRTVLDVANEPGALALAIERVADPLAGDLRNRVLVQAMARDVAVSGVIVTCDPTTGAPYYVVEYDGSGRTDTVTSGLVSPTTAVIFRDAPARTVECPTLRRLLEATREIERWRRDTALEIEFAATLAGDITLLQVRPLPRRTPGVGVRRVARALAGAAAVLRACGRPRRRLAGRRTMLAQMSDWNPAELLGAYPSPLASSVFADLVSDDVWQRARATMGYRALPGVPLVHLVAGRCYVDVRASFNSFLPASMSARAANALVDAWLARLSARPELHDKVELEVAQTAVDFAFGRRYRERFGRPLRDDDFAAWSGALRRVTNRAVATERSSSLARALATAGRMPAATPGRTSDAELLPRALRLLAICRRAGTVPFAVVARHAFIAEVLLRSAVERHALLPERVDAFRRSLPTITRRIAADLRAVTAGDLPRTVFLRRYGHLRPSSFDVGSLRYDQRPELFANPGVTAPVGRVRFVPRGAELRALDTLAREAGLAFDGRTLFRYAGMAIVGRERVKYLFSRLLSDALELIARWGDARGLARPDVAFLTLGELRAFAAATAWRRPPGASGAAAVHALVARRRAVATEQGVLRLAPLLRDASDLYAPPALPALPTFVTARTVTAAPVVLHGRDRGREVAGHIVCIESADPGFDWLFAHPIAGLVTRFGGGNSHMAIRCIEAGVPAALGVGEHLFAILCQAPAVELRCADRLVRAL